MATTIGSYICHVLVVLFTFCYTCDWHPYEDELYDFMKGLWIAVAEGTIQPCRETLAQRKKEFVGNEATGVAHSMFIKVRWQDDKSTDTQHASRLCGLRCCRSPSIAFAWTDIHVCTNVRPRV